MDFLKQLFGPSKDEVWRQLAGQVGGVFREGGFWGKDAVQVQVVDWIITLDTYTVSTGKSSTTYTRIRAPFVNRDGLWMQVYRSGIFTELGKLLGMQDIEVGIPEFDGAFVIKGNDADKIRRILHNERIRLLISQQPNILFGIRNVQEGIFGANYPPGVSEVYFQVIGILTNVDQLKSLYDLFAEFLNYVCHMDSAYQDSLELFARDLFSPGGRIEREGLLLWDGDPGRRRAAEALGRSGDPRAPGLLVQVLEDRDDQVRALALEGLGRLGDPHCVRAVIPSLGGGTWVERKAATDALTALGSGQIADAVNRLLQGDFSRIEVCKAGYRAEAVQALVRALRPDDPGTAVHAARGLVEFGAVETMSVLRALYRAIPRAEQEVRTALDECIQRLEGLQALPRPADAPHTDAASLPRPAAPPASRGEDLPVPSAPAPAS